MHRPQGLSRRPIGPTERLRLCMITDARSTAAMKASRPIHACRAKLGIHFSRRMRTDHDFSIDQLIAEAPTLRRLDGVAADMRIAVHEMRMKHAHVGFMHARGQAVRLELDVGVDPARPTGVECSAKHGAGSVGGALCIGADAKGKRGNDIEGSGAS